MDIIENIFESIQHHKIFKATKEFIKKKFIKLKQRISVSVDKLDFIKTDIQDLRSKIIKNISLVFNSNDTLPIMSPSILIEGSPKIFESAKSKSIFEDIFKSIMFINE